MRGRGHGGLADPVESTAGEISNEDQSNAVALPAAASD
ncbi:unnamed protein product [Protopolystoma xenopodis]|uniref:Uncharacterized protein n=1 Tax=Protopolystoma xenopodis TaxID=117903 RepID=A0A3S5A1K2_9PLAT|nr:unnamed protein product [Protopolystoma xenopodis]